MNPNISIDTRLTRLQSRIAVRKGILGCGEGFSVALHSRGDVLYVANVVASAAGHDEANIQMLETWLMENHIVIGLYVPYEVCLTSQSAGEPVVYDGCVAVGGLLPPPAEAE